MPVPHLNFHLGIATVTHVMCRAQRTIVHALSRCVPALALRPALLADVAGNAVQQTRSCYRSPCDLFVRPCLVLCTDTPAQISPHLPSQSFGCSSRRFCRQNCLLALSLWFALHFSSICAFTRFPRSRLPAVKKVSAASPRLPRDPHPSPRCLCYCARIDRH